ncbi:DUF6221 family protein [Streptomyces marianii]|uniref:Uncharacterized protein n=1 Tax=Streptomyces marianii TaxID=1817406 RepID=A0A5R9E6W2_9ACTN|nr:DUF6221 family protein [Streptomyces marianii]TLQ45770.1 hypothetical protein FEF34_24730 [Streptomyces marianii]
MSDLVQFIRDILDMEERTARMAAGKSPRWYAGSASDEPRNSDRACVANGGDEAITGDTDASYADHIVWHDPARVLDRIANDRAVLDAYAEVADLDTGESEPEFAYGRAAGLGIAVRRMAALYSNHRDYRTEWEAS